MQRFFSVLLTLALLCSGLALAEEEGVSGAWYGSLNGMVFSLELNEDGTAAFFGAEGTWSEQEGIITVCLDDGTQEFETSDEGLLYGDDTMELVMTRDMPEMYIPSSTVAIEDPAAIYGTYEAVAISVSGMVVSMESADPDMLAVLFGVADGVTLELVIAEGNVMLAGGEPAAVELQDGSLVAVDDETGYQVSLTENGDIVLTIPAMNTFIYFTQAAE